MDRSWRITAADAVLGAALCAAVVAAVVVTQQHWLTALGVGSIALVGPALARIDLAVRRLPNPLTLPALAISAVVSIGHVVTGSWLGPLVALAAAAVLLLMNLVGGMGMGDVKLGAAVVFALSASPLGVLGGLTASFVLGGAVGIGALLAGHRTLPFGPFLISGMLVGVTLECFTP